MDPTAALLMLLNALKDEERTEAIEAMDGLTGWLTNGGFFPNTVKATEDFMDRVTDLDSGEEDDDD